MLRAVELADDSPMRSSPLSRFLQSVPVFNGLEGRSLESVVKVLRRHDFPPGTVICAEGELGRTMYVVEKGEVEVLRSTRDGRQVPIVRLGKSECFGEMALVELEARSATVAALTRTIAYSLNNHDLYRLFKADNFAFTIVLQNVCRLLSRRLRKADSRIAEFVGERAAPASAPAAPKRARRTAPRPAAKKARRTSR